MILLWLFCVCDVQVSFVVYLLFKYIGGYGNVLGGVVVDMGLFDWVVYLNIYLVYCKVKLEMQGIQQICKKGLCDQGVMLIVDVVYCIVVGVEMMVLCVDCICSNVLVLVCMLVVYLKVVCVYYFGLLEYFEYVCVIELFCYYGGLLSFELVDGVDYVDMFDYLCYVVCVMYLGDMCMLVILVVLIIYWEMGVECCVLMGIVDLLVCVLVGIEDEVDLLVDFMQVLDVMVVG